MRYAALTALVLVALGAGERLTHENKILTHDGWALVLGEGGGAGGGTGGGGFDYCGAPLPANNPILGDVEPQPPESSTTWVGSSGWQVTHADQIDFAYADGPGVPGSVCNDMVGNVIQCSASTVSTRVGFRGLPAHSVTYSIFWNGSAPLVMQDTWTQQVWVKAIDPVSDLQFGNEDGTDKVACPISSGAWTLCRWSLAVDHGYVMLGRQLSAVGPLLVGSPNILIADWNYLQFPAALPCTNGT